MKSTNGLYEFEILVNGKHLKEFIHEDRIYIEGKNGSEFTLRFKSHSMKKLLIVPAVDGLSVLDGKEANEYSGGYVVNPWGTCEIKGWRKNLEEVAAFIFAQKDRSYVAGSDAGDVLNCGVIGLRVYEEKHNPIVSMPIWEKTRGSNFGYNRRRIKSSLSDTLNFSASLSEGDATMDLAETLYSAEVKSSGAPKVDVIPDFNLGTGWGSNKQDLVQKTEFKQGPLVQTFTVFYSDREGLEKAGISVKYAKKIIPSAFSDDFCTPPKFR